MFINPNQTCNLYYSDIMNCSGILANDINIEKSFLNKNGSKNLEIIKGIRYDSVIGFINCYVMDGEFF